MKKQKLNLEDLKKLEVKKIEEVKGGYIVVDDLILI